MTFARHHRNFIMGFVFATALPFSALGQTSEPTSAPAQQQQPQRLPENPTLTRVLYLRNLTTQQEANEVLTALRNSSHPRDRITLVPSQNALVIDAPAEDIAAAEKLLVELDKPKKSYRLTYTLIDFDGTKRVGDQHYSMALISGQRTVLKQGNRVPIFTGPSPKDPQSQVTYIDIGMNFEATIDDAPGAFRLRTKIEQTGVAEDRTSTLAQDPIIRQSFFEGSAVLVSGKPFTVGSLDIAGTTRRVEIQATIEPLTR